MRLLLITLLSVTFFMVQAQEDKKKPDLYNPSADAKSEIAIAVENAKKANKNVMIQVGGNWCSWCIEFHRFIKEDSLLSATLQNNYEYVLLNYSKEQKNEDVLADFQFPQRMGFPVFIVLDDMGDRIHTQNSWYLEKEKSYDPDKVKNFFDNWSTDALNPEHYMSKEEKSD